MRAPAYWTDCPFFPRFLLQYPHLDKQDLAMLVIISPAKTLDYDSPLATERFTQPEMLDKSKQLIKIC
ncbi:hypothetical protein RF034_20945, partial [Serratia marcescens]|nr:hypothetical protein [Serratia marcescens]